MKKFDFSKEINADTTVYLKFTELKEETTVKEEKNPATIGGKAFCKRIAIDNNHKIVYMTAKVISKFEKKKK